MSLTATLLEMVRANPFATFVAGLIVSTIFGIIIGGSGFGQDPGRKILRGAFYGTAIMCFILITGAILHIWVLVS